MTVADAASVATLIVDLIALYFLISIWKDDRAMRIAAEESLKAQLEYLGLRRKWYESRTKKEKTVSVVGSTSQADVAGLISPMRKHTASSNLAPATNFREEKP